MSPSMKNQWRMRSKIFSGWPKKNAAWLSSLKRKCGTSPGTVSTCQATKIPASTTSCQKRSQRRFTPGRRAMGSDRLGELLLVAGQHLFAQHVPDRLVQLHETRRGANLGHVARAGEIDAEFADRMRGGSRGQHHHAGAHRDGLVEVVRDEQHGLLLQPPQREHLVLHQRARLHVEGGE